MPTEQNDFAKISFFKMEQDAKTQNPLYTMNGYNITIDVNNNSDPYRLEADINGNKVDITDEYLKAKSGMEQFELAFADVNQDGREDVIMQVKAFRGSGFAVFLAGDNGYKKLCEPKDTQVISVNLLGGGKMEVSCPAIHYKKEMEITRAFAAWLQPDAAGVYDDQGNLKKNLSLDTSAEGGTLQDVYEYELTEQNGVYELAVKKVIVYNNAGTGAAYTNRYTIGEQGFQYKTTEIYYSDVQTR